MKKNILKATIVAAFVLIAGMNVNNAQKSDVMSGLALANVEVLAYGESLNMLQCDYYGCTISIMTDCHVYQYGLYKGACSGYRA
ncbi:NVEALA domain-containing protein [Phocaeicola sartorii]|uniref:NVEALA domain-containing protein n=1 Tax=Phocaeicola sartorii TaxID=671267 RepID=UPI001361F5FB|nr:NVEALA domain-containing protein [Phocaeicola sartorii]NBH68576.1 hypothetical protein [Phocaeicola sartorii]